MASQSAMKTAIQEIRRGEQLMNLLHSHLQLHSTPATELSKGIQQALTAALAILKSRESTETNTVEIELDRSTTQRKRRPMAVSDDQNEGDQKRRKSMNSRTIVTPAPYFDGHQWRKYGQKMIHNSKHPRHYYRCTHRKDKGCLATKLVQEEESDDSPMFRVIYSNQHTCNRDCTPQIIFSSPQRQSNFFIFESKESYSGLSNIESNQEQLNSLSPKNEGSSGEVCNFDSKNQSSDFRKAKIGEETSSTSMIMDFPLSPDFNGIDFDDVDSILSLFS